MSIFSVEEMTNLYLYGKILSISKNFGRLKCLLLKISFSLVIILLFACSSKEPRTPVKELGFDAYMYKALNVDFEFEYEIIKYYVSEMEQGGFGETFVIRVKFKDLEKITNSIKLSNSCQVVSTPAGNPLNASAGTVSGYRCVTDLRSELLSAYAFFKEDFNEITFAFSDLHLTGVF